MMFDAPAAMKAVPMPTTTPATVTHRPVIR